LFAIGHLQIGNGYRIACYAERTKVRFAERTQIV
jgi:hypothetical protein